MMARAATDQSFFLAGEYTDPVYRKVRDNPNNNPELTEAKCFVASLWTRYKNLNVNDRNFLQEAKKDFLARFWEIYLAVALSEHGFELKKDRSAGPEFYFIHNGRKVWVEAVAPGPGVKEDDLVPDYFSSEVTKIKGGMLEIVEIPEEKIILRYTNAIDKKREKYQDALTKGIIGNNDLYLLAINSRGIPYASRWMGIPYFVKALIPFGEEAVLWDTKTGEIGKPFYQKRERIIKAKGSPVPTTAFLNPEFSFISAILHSGVDCISSHTILGDDFIVLHNPTADHPIDPTVFRWCDQMFYKDGKLERRLKQKLQK
ncbi:MAG: hypothetical protein PHU23_17450 [Dehalococcoidales bacterium]|nr:hypothetical protein [Dehalococcoidales bacterium]